MLHGEAGQVEIVSLAKDMIDYLDYEASVRGVSKLEVYRQEMSAKAALDALGDDEEFLARAESMAQWPDKYMVRDEQKPF